MTGPAHRVCLLSDVHFDVHHAALWENFCRWHKEHRPELTVCMGDVVDLGMISKYAQGPGEPANAVEQVVVATEQLNRIAKSTGRLVCMKGNHDERWEKAVAGEHGPELTGAKGLRLEDQFYAQGLSQAVKWIHESKMVPGLILGRNAALLQHGHKGMAKPAGTKYLAAGQLAEISSMSSVRGHLHRAQLMCRTELGRTITAIAMPHMSGYHEYCGGNPNWQRGFAELTFYGRSRLRDCQFFTSSIVIADSKGAFAYNGKLYG